MANCDNTDFEQPVKLEIRYCHSSSMRFRKSSGDASAKYRVFASKYMWRSHTEKERCLAKDSKYMPSRNQLSLLAHICVRQEEGDEQAGQFSHSTSTDSDKGSAESVATLLEAPADK